MKPKNLLVVGNPRSGTSMVAGIFANRGYFLAQDEDHDLREGDENNPGGYWESETLVRRNVEVLEAAGFSHDNTWMFEPITAEAAERIGALDPLPGHIEFVRSYEAHSPWLWKDPRLCYTLAYWWKLLDPETTRVLLTGRNEDAIYKSFLRIKWREESPEAQEDVYRRVADHTAAARRAVEQLDIPHLGVDYDDFAREPHATAATLSELAGLKLSAGDIGFDERFDHSRFRGRLATALDRLAERLPAGVRRAMKRLLPRWFIEALFPGRG